MEEPETNRLTPRDIILRYGLICGALGILFVAILYMIDAGLMFGYYAYIGFIFTFGVAVIAAVKRRKHNDGIISYGDAVTTSLAVFSIGQTMYTLFMILLYFVIDPHLIDKMKSVQMDRMDRLMANGTLNKVQYTAAQSSIENMSGNTILFYSIMGLIVMIIISLLIFLLTSIFIKNESPFKKELN